MSKKSIWIRSFAMLLALIAMLPALFTRITQENKNKDVIAAINFNNFEMTLSEYEFDKSLNDFYKIGVKTAVLAEESVNSLINSGYITGIKYNVLCHKYDDESEEIIKQLKDNKAIHNDSYVLITKRQSGKEYLRLWIPAKYKSNEYTFIKTDSGADVYVIHEGAGEAWQVSTGFVIEKIEKAKAKGYDIVLSMMVNNYSTTEYVNIIDELIKKYDIHYINLKNNYRKKNAVEKGASKNYNALCRLIEDNNLTLIVTENQDQLSNQKPLGYEKLIKSADGRIMRSYETLNMQNSGETEYQFRYYQMLNSVIDRNIRLVSINQLTNGTDTFESKNERTLKATKLFLDKIRQFGYNTDGYHNDFSGYKINRRLVSAAGMIIMIIMLLTMLEWIFGASKSLEMLFLLGGALSIPFSYLAPDGIVLLYPTLFAVIAPCFCITMVFIIIRALLSKLNVFMLIITGAAFTLFSLSLCGAVQSALLSGADYYINTLIFRGIKLSLIAPILYGAIAFGIIFCKKKNESVISKIPAVLNADIKVFWVMIAAVIGLLAVIYIIRSGNVQSISSAESTMRNAITNAMSARPRTKEFIVGWPCFTLMIFYLKKYRGKLAPWIMAMGASILFASTINSFCHVFTSVSTIYMRVVNSLWLGIIFSVILYIVNIIFIMAVKKLINIAKEAGEI